MPTTAIHRIIGVPYEPTLFIGDRERSFQPGDSLILNQVDATNGDYNVLWIGANPSECITREFWLADKTALKDFEALLVDKWLFRKDASDVAPLCRAVYYLIDKTPD